MAENKYFNSVIKKMEDKKNLKFNIRYALNFDNNQGEDEIDVKGEHMKIEVDSNTGDQQLILVNGEESKNILNLTHINKNKTNFNIENISLNTSEHVAYTYSEKGDISYKLIIKPIGKNETIDSINYVQDFYWKSDSVIVYIKDDSVTYRSCQLKFHKIGDSPILDSLIFEEKRETFDIEFEESTSQKQRYVVNSSLDSIHYYKISNDSMHYVLNKDGRLQKMDHLGSHLYKIVENEDLFKIFVKSDTIRSEWCFVYETKFPILDIYETKTFLCIKQFERNTPVLKVIHLINKEIKQIDLPGKYCSFHFNFETNYNEQDLVTIDYSSPKHPFNKYKVDLIQGKMILLEEEKLNQWVRKDDLVTELIWAKSIDGKEIPITIFYNKKLLGANPRGLVVKSYGAYGSIKSPSFDTENLIYANDSLLTAYIHVRGGSELGYKMYKEGRQLNKINSFKDFISATKFLQKEFNVSPDKTIAYGTSAGGLIMGYLANNYPSYYGGLIFDKPFLDVMNTMTNKKLPITTMEYSEWGNPENEEYKNYILQYSPYQNISKNKFPNMIFFSKYFDKQTPSYQIVKSVAKFRENNEGSGMILLQTDLKSGHRGSVETGAAPDLISRYNFVNYVLRSSGNR